MRYLASAIALLLCTVLQGQTDSLRRDTSCINTDSLLPGYEFSYILEQNKVSIYLFDGKIVKGSIGTVYERILTLQSKQDRNAVPAKPLILIPIDSIAVIYFKRNSFFTGMVAGAFLGFIGGYGLGRMEYENETEIDRIWKSIKLGAVTMVPLSVIGALVGPIITKKRFEIWGSRHNLLGILIKLDLVKN